MSGKNYYFLPNAERLSGLSDDKRIQIIYRFKDERKNKVAVAVELISGATAHMLLVVYLLGFFVGNEP